MAKKATTKKAPEAKASADKKKGTGFEGHVNAADLAGALARIKSVATKTKFATLPAVACVHLAFTDEQLLATGTDLEATLRLPIPAGVEAEGAIAVNANRLYAIAKGLGDEALRLRAIVKKGDAGTVLEVKGKTVRYELLTLPAEEYPPLPTPLTGTVVQVDREVLTVALKRVRVAASQDESRPFLMGVYCEAGGETLKVTATDGHRLAQQTVPLLEKVKATKWLIPSAAVDLIVDLAKQDDDGKDGPVRLAGTDKAVQVSVGAAQLWTKQIEGTFPNYMSVVEQQKKNTTLQVPTVPTEALRNGLALAGLVSARGSAVVTLTFSEDEVSVFCRDEIGTAEATVAMPWPGDEPLAIGFKAPYLLDYLSEAPETGVSLGCGGPLDPILFTEERGMYVVMPMRLEKPPEVMKKPETVVAEPVIDEPAETIEVGPVDDGD